MGELAVKSHAKSTRHKNLEQPKTQNTVSTFFTISPKPKTMSKTEKPSEAASGDINVGI